MSHLLFPFLRHDNPNCFSNESQILRRPCPDRRKVAIDSLHDFSQASMVVVLLIPLILVVFYPLARSLAIFFCCFLECQSDEVVYVESLGRQSWCPRSLHFKHNGAGFLGGACCERRGRDDFDCSGGGRLHDCWDAPPLACDLIAGVAVWVGELGQSLDNMLSKLWVISANLQDAMSSYMAFCAYTCISWAPVAASSFFPEPE
jgi:hypothetical protein